MSPLIQTRAGASALGYGALTTFVTPNNFTSIATGTMTGGTSNLTFSSIPQTYTHLQLRYMTSSPGGSIYIQFNGDTGTNYTQHYLLGNGSSVSAAGSASYATPHISDLAYGGDSPYPMVAIVDIVDYKNTNKYKTFKTISGIDANSAGIGGIDILSGVWMNTNAISSIYISCGQNLDSGSVFALYGIQ